MTRYIEFLQGEQALLVEVDDEEVTPAPGVKKAGLSDSLQGAVARAGSAFDVALRTAVHYNTQPLIDAIKSLPNPPDEVEISFGLKATGEVGNFAISKAAGEANYTVKFAWRS